MSLAGAAAWLLVPGGLIALLGWWLRPTDAEPPRVPLALGLLVHAWTGIAVLLPGPQQSPLVFAVRASTPLLGLLLLRALQRWYRVADDRWGALELLYIGWALLGTPWLLLRAGAGLLG